MHKPESILKNKAQKMLSDFEIQMDDLIPARSSLLIINKKRELAI